jgi:hypothetical protein
LSGGRILILLFGILLLLGAFPLIIGGGILLWVEISLKDSEGYISTSAYQLESDSYAIVTEHTRVDLDEGWSWGWFRSWDLGDLVTLKIEGTNNNPKGILIGVAEAEESAWQEYISDVEYDEIIQFSFSPYEVLYQNHPGSSEPEGPASQTFWKDKAFGTGTQDLEWELETGTYSMVLMNQDGSRDVDVDISLGAKIPLIFGFGVGLLVGGVVAITIGIIVIIFSLRGRRRSRLSKPRHTKPMHIIKRV